MRYLNIGRVGDRVRKERRRVSRHVPSDRRQQEPQMMWSPTCPLMSLFMCVGRALVEVHRIPVDLGR